MQTRGAADARGGASRRKPAQLDNQITVRDRDARPAPDLVERNFTAGRPNRLWVADISAP
jgi:putative transposase